MANPQPKPTHSSPFESDDNQTHVEEEEKSGSDSEPKQKTENETQTLIPPPQSTNKLQNPSEDFDSDHLPEESPKKPNLNSTKLAKKRLASASEKEEAAKKAKKKKKKKNDSKEKLQMSASEKEEAAKKAKKKKKKKNDSKEKLQMFQRLWSEDDEVVILKGLIKYKKQNNGVVVICADMHDFHNYIKKKLHVDVSTSQLVGKIRKLRKKYENNTRKEKNGRDGSGLKPHELKCYKLSKSIWASDNVAGASNENEKDVCLVKSKGSGHDINRFVKYASSCNGDLVLVEEIINVGMELVQGFKRDEFKEKLNELKKEELKLCVKRNDFVSALTKVVLEAL